MIKIYAVEWFIEEKGFTAFQIGSNIRRTYGEMAEWLKAPVLKTGKG